MEATKKMEEASTKTKKELSKTPEREPSTPQQQQTTTNPIAKKLNKILDSKLETDQDMLNSLETVSTFFTDNTLQKRRNLRKDIESRSLETNREFLNSFRKVKDKLDEVENEIEGMSQCVSAMSQRLQQTKGQTRELINTTTSLQNESRKVEKKAEVVTAFLAAFQLKPDENRALKGKEDGASITREFFPALNRVKEIHEDCKQLLRLSPHTPGMEIMEKMSTTQESAYELLYRWIQRETRLLNVDYVDLNPLLAEAFKAMLERPVLFKYSLDEFSTARRNNMVRSFIDALTRGGPGGVPKAMELLSHDPLRYVGDMLAWIHQSLASEKELIEALFKLTPQSVYEEHSASVLTHITDGLCRPFKVRVEQVLNGENPPVVLYKLSNLFIFYMETVKTSLTEKASLILVMDELKQLTLNLFFSSLTNHLQRLLEKMESPGADLLPVPGLHQILLLLRDVLESHDSTLVPVTNKKENFERMFKCVLDPLQQGIMLSGSGLGGLELAVFLLNSLNAVHSMISLYQYTDSRLEMIQAQMEAQEDVLVSEGAGFILARTSLSNIYHITQKHAPEQGPLSAIAHMEPLTLTNALEKFDLFLASPDKYCLSETSLITSSKIKDKVERRTMEVILEAYTLLYNKITDPANNYPNPTSIITKTPQQISSLILTC